LRSLKSFEQLTVKITSEFMPISYCQLDSRIYFGLYWSRVSAGNGRIVLVDTNSDIGRFLANEFKELWDSAQEDGLTGNPPEPDHFHRKFHADFYWR
jgi:hypothetical protein